MIWYHSKRLIGTICHRKLIPHRLKRFCGTKSLTLPRLSLMRRPEQIQDHLHRIERIQRNLDKTRIPVTHRTVPQARKLESLEFTALVTLGTHETCILIHEIQKIELITLIIPDTADKIHRIEMSSTRQDITGTLIILIWTLSRI